MKKLVSIGILSLGLSLAGCNTGNKEYVHVGPNWAALHAVKPSAKTFDVTIDVAGSALLGDTLALKVKSEQAGRLWIMQVDPNDNVTLMYPNAIARENQIAANTWTRIPNEGSRWSIEAMRPTGVSVLAFIVTAPGTDLTDVFNGQPEEMNKALRLVENSPAWGLAKQVIDIRESEQ